jgi:uncharacterized membrane protein
MEEKNDLFPGRCGHHQASGWLAGWLTDISHFWREREKRPPLICFLLLFTAAVYTQQRTACQNKLIIISFLALLDHHHHHYHHSHTGRYTINQQTKLDLTAVVINLLMTSFITQSAPHFSFKFRGLFFFFFLKSLIAI